MKAIKVSKMLLWVALFRMASAYAGEPVVYADTYSSPRNAQILQVEVDGQSSDAVFVWAYVPALDPGGEGSGGEYCFNVGNGSWSAPIVDQPRGSLFYGTAHCNPAAYMSQRGGSRVIRVLNGLNLNSSVYNGTTVYVDIFPVGAAYDLRYPRWEALNL